MGLKIITGRNTGVGRKIVTGPNNEPRGPGVVWLRCGDCNGEGVQYPDATRCIECPKCQGYGLKPFRRSQQTELELIRQRQDPNRGV